MTTWRGSYRAPGATPYYEDDLITLYRANALNLPLADDSVDLVVTSPPYFGLRSYQDGGEHYDGQIGAEATPAEFVDALIDATREMVRVTKPTGSIWVNLGDKYAGGGGYAPDAPSNVGNNRHGDGKGGARSASNRGAAWGYKPKSLIGIPWRYAIRCIDDLCLVLRAEVIWSKPNGLPESVTDRVRRSHEHWFHFTLEPRYYSAVDEVREAVGVSHARGKGQGDDSRGDNGVPIFRPNPLGKLPGSVWTIPTEPLRVPDHLGIDHFAAFPTEWPRRIIQGWSPEGGVVLDPFSGTGTTALVASVLGRHGIGVDMSEDYCRLAKWRTTDPKQRARAARKPWTPPAEQLPGQEALDFGGVQ